MGNHKSILFEEAYDETNSAATFYPPPTLLPIALAALGTLSALPAQAGYWQVQTTVRESGEVTNYNSAATPPERRTSLTKTNFYPIGDIGALGYINWSQGWTNSASAVAGTDHTFQVDMTFTWNPNSTMTSGSHQKNRLALWMNVLVNAVATGTNPTVLTSCDGLPIPATRPPFTEGLSEQRRGKVLLQMDNSALSNTLTKTFVFKSMARAQASSTSPNDSSGRAYFEISVAFESRSVQISSDIEPSYYKSTVAPTPMPQPTAAPGTPAPTPQPTPLPVANTDPPVWRLPVQRKIDGSMDVHSAAKWQEHLDGTDSAGNWYGLHQGETVTANHSGVTNPSFRWSFSGGSLSEHAAQELSKDAATLRFYSLAALASSVGVNLGGFLSAPSGSSNTDVGFGNIKQSVFTVDVTDGNDPSTKRSNTYTINWHLPMENIVEYGTPVNSYTTAPAAVVEGYPASTNEPDETIRVLVDPSVWNFALLVSDGQRAAAGTVFFAGMTAATYFSAGVLPVTAHLAYKAVIAGTAQGIQSGFVESYQETCTNSLSQWQSAVADTQSALGGSTTHDVRISPSSLAVSNSDLRQLCAMTPWVMRRYTARFFKGDTYDGNGYSGEGRGHFDMPSKPEVVGYYELVTSPINE